MKKVNKINQVNIGTVVDKYYKEQIEQSNNIYEMGINT